MLINLQQSCQLDCVFCMRRSRFPAEKTSPEEVRRLISETDDEKVVFSGGGEPTMEPLLPEYIRFASGRGKTPVVQTNGIALCDMKYLKDLVSCGLKGITLTVHSHVPEIYDEVTQTPGAFSKLEEALKNISEFPGLVGVVYVPSTSISMSFEHFRGLWEFLKDHGLEVPLCFTGFRPNDASETTDRYLPDYDELGKELARIFRFCQDNGRDYGITTASAVPPCKLRGFETKVMNTEDFRTYYDYKRLFTHPEGCGGCRVKEFCIGVPKHYLRLRKFRPEPLKGVDFLK
jgi:MoaA/NifB/PqqE/SkfB family radical SAM enzyme